jgi:hypothetical protein
LRHHAVVCLFLVALCLTGLLLSTATAAPISAAAQQVVDELEQKGFNVTFVYFGSDPELTFNTEDCAVVVMFTHEHIKNQQYLASHEQQFSEGNKSLARAYPNAEAFLVALIEDLNGNGVPDSVDNGVHAQGFYQLSGGVYGGRTSTAFRDEYWVNSCDYVSGTAPSPSPSPIPTPTEQPQQPKNWSALEVSCQSTALYMNFKVDIIGRLFSCSGGIADAQVLLSYSVNAGESWLDLTTAITDSDGAFSEVWMPHASGYYLLKADFRGNADYYEANRTVNFVVLPFEEKHVFSVTSNSTVTALSFDSTSQTLSFSVNGTSNTTGYVSLSLPKSLVSETSTLKVYLDNEPLAYTAIAENDALLVTFTYHHSSHEVAIQMNQSNSANDVYFWIAVVVVIILVAVVSVVEAVKRRK